MSYPECGRWIDRVAVSAQIVLSQTRTKSMEEEFHMQKSVLGKLAASAVAGLFVASVAHAEGAAPAAGHDAKVVKCSTACKGKSECKGNGNASCKGQNSCKGHGWTTQQGGHCPEGTTVVK